jgi:hypothetical protein
LNNLVSLVLGLLIPSLLLSLPVNAQNEKDSNPIELEMIEQILSNIPDSILKAPTPVQRQLMDDATLAVYQDALHAYYDYRVSGFQHRKEVFGWQLFSSRLIFWTVLLLVFSGIAFSGVQFYKSINKNILKGETTFENNITEFEASAKGVKVTSPVLGVIILVISLAFFYLYLIYVYPITDIF